MGQVIRTFLLLSTFLFSAVTMAAWYKGNTHTHTKLSGHGDTPPPQVATWYHNRGYNFLVLSEHNRFIDPTTVKIKNQREDFILIGGVEVSGAKIIHTTALNVSQVIPFQFDSTEKSKIVQYHVDQVHGHGGEPILNHPNFSWALSFDDILPVENLGMFELYNGHPHVHNDGDHEHDSTEVLWDKLLSAGRKIYGVSSDDAHWFQEVSADKSNPGRGWVMVEADELTADAITNAMKEGRFYSSNGVVLSEVSGKNGQYDIQVNVPATILEIKKGHVVGKKVDEQTPLGVSIQYISTNGEIVQEFQSDRASLKIGKWYQYVRAKITYTVMKKTGKRQFYAWAQPVFP